MPLIVWGKSCKQGVDLGVRKTFGDIGTTVSDLLGAPDTGLGTSFKEEIL